MLDRGQSLYKILDREPPGAQDPVVPGVGQDAAEDFWLVDGLSGCAVLPVDRIKTICFEDGNLLCVSYMFIKLGFSLF